MAISKYNSEGYHDPTTYEALKIIEKEERTAKRAVNLHKPDEFRPLVYICSPYRGDTEKNVEKQDSTLALQLRIRRSLLLRIFCIHSLWMTVIRKKDIWQTIPSIMYWLESARKCGCLERMSRKGWLVR